ncbi:unnamed protein product [Arctogadus glacialis]
MSVRNKEATLIDLVLCVRLTRVPLPYRPLHGAPHAGPEASHALHGQAQADLLPLPEAIPYEGNVRHISILSDGDTPTINKCTNRELFHCPFCKYVGAKYMVDNHIKGHSSVKHKGFTMINSLWPPLITHWSPLSTKRPPLSTHWPPLITQRPRLSTHWPPLSTHCPPPLSTHWPQLITQRPPLITQRPPLIPQRPPLITQRPPLIPQRPPLIPQRPPLSTHWPQLITQRPPLITQRPPLIPQRPPLITQRPPLITQRPPLITQRPPLIPQRPPLITQRPPLITQRPPLITQRPPLITHRLLQSLKKTDFWTEKGDESKEANRIWKWSLQNQFSYSESISEASEEAEYLTELGTGSNMFRASKNQ